MATIMKLSTTYCVLLLALVYETLQFKSKAARRLYRDKRSKMPQVCPDGWYPWDNGSTGTPLAPIKCCPCTKCPDDSIYSIDPYISDDCWEENSNVICYSTYDACRDRNEVWYSLTTTTVAPNTTLPSTTTIRPTTTTTSTTKPPIQEVIAVPSPQYNNTALYVIIGVLLVICVCAIVYCLLWRKTDLFKKLKNRFRSLCLNTKDQGQQMVPMFRQDTVEEIKQDHIEGGDTAGLLSPPPPRMDYDQIQAAAPIVQQESSLGGKAGSTEYSFGSTCDVKNTEQDRYPEHMPHLPTYHPAPPMPPPSAPPPITHAPPTNGNGQNFFAPVENVTMIQVLSPSHLILHGKPHVVQMDPTPPQSFPSHDGSTNRATSFTRSDLDSNSSLPCRHGVTTPFDSVGERPTIMSQNDVDKTGHPFHTESDFVRSTSRHREPTEHSSVNQDSTKAHVVYEGHSDAHEVPHGAIYQHGRYPAAGASPEGRNRSSAASRFDSITSTPVQCMQNEEESNFSSSDIIGPPRDEFHDGK